MLLALLIAAAPCAGMGPVDHFTDCILFHSPQEAANFSAHVGWSLALPLAGHAVAGKEGALVVGGTWLGFSLVNEFALHGHESARERNLNLISRIVPCAAIMLWELFRD